MAESELHRRIKYAIAKKLIEMGYIAGVEVYADGNRFDVIAMKNDETIAFEVHMTNLPNWWKSRINPEAPRGIVTESDEYERRDIDLGVLHGKPHSEISKLKVFMEIFNGISGQDKNDVNLLDFVDELIKTGKFNEEEALSFIKKAEQNGQIYQRKKGEFAKA